MRRYLSKIGFSLSIMILIAISGFQNQIAQKSKPEVIKVGIAAPDIIELTIQSKWVKHGIQVPYEKQAGDEIQIQGQHALYKA